MFGADQKFACEKAHVIFYSPFLAMEDLLEKLKLLNYETELLEVLIIKPIHR